MKCIICDKEIELRKNKVLFIVIDSGNIADISKGKTIIVCKDCCKSIKTQLDSPLLYMVKDFLIKKELYESLFNK